MPEQLPCCCWHLLRRRLIDYADCLLRRDADTPFDAAMPIIAGLPPALFSPFTLADVCCRLPYAAETSLFFCFILFRYAIISLRCHCCHAAFMPLPRRSPFRCRRHATLIDAIFADALMPLRYLRHAADIFALICC